jgi:elongation factor Tu
MKGKSMSADPFFRMTVEDVFFIRGRGVVVTGQIESGTLNVHDEIYIRRQDSSKKTVVTGIEMLRKQLDQAQAGDNVGILLRDVTKQDIEHGDVLLGSDIEFGLNS